MQTMIKILKKPIVSTIIAIFSGFVVASIILAIAGFNPFEAMSAMFQGVFERPKSITNVIIKATPIILTGISVAFAFKTGLFNIGAEGQYIAGTIAATIVGISLDLPAFLQIPIVILSGMVAGAIFGGLVGFLKAKFGIHEVITSIMFNWIAFYLQNYIVSLKVFHKDKTSGTYPINENGWILVFNKNAKEALRSSLKKNSALSEVILRTDINYGIIIAVIVAILVSILLYKTTKGFELRAVGFNPNASQCAGINVKRNILQSMIIAGAISGLAGALMISGMAPHNISTINVFENNGFNGLSVALIAGSSPIGCIFAGLLFSGLIFGGQSIQSKIGAPLEIINIMIGTIVFFVALTTIVPVISDKLAKRRAERVK